MMIMVMMEDAILIKVVGHLTKAIRDEDALGCFGGDELVMLINPLDADEQLGININ